LLVKALFRLRRQDPARFADVHEVIFLFKIAEAFFELIGFAVNSRVPDLQPRFYLHPSEKRAWRATSPNDQMFSAVVGRAKNPQFEFGHCPATVKAPWIRCLVAVKLRRLPAGRLDQLDIRPSDELCEVLHRQAVRPSGKPGVGLDHG